MRVVLDTNVLVSALIRPGGKPDQVLRRGASRFDLLSSELILVELEETLSRRHIQTKYKPQVTPRKRKRFLARLRAVATLVAIKSELRGIVTDPNDEAVLAAAVDGHADYLVTGDRHLLAVAAHQGVQIVTPEAFLRALEGL